MTEIQRNEQQTGINDQEYQQIALYLLWLIMAILHKQVNSIVIQPSG